ncbi:protein MIS12 homolog [Myripristis murdjan]|uniref:Protein MIS12 homolog n=1 Tax=Myripristis murdjan TaxID=586833 RepID=A0A667WXS6_9TELE|nr:protein MIS12 homolog [Myripristis murdjan]
MAACRVAEEDGGPLPAGLNLYEAQFFGFTPQTCLLRVYSAFQDCLSEILLVVEKVCVRALRGADPAADPQLLRSEARRRGQELQRLLEQRFQRLAARMEALLLHGCFSVPDNVLLPEDEPHRKYPQATQEVLRLESSLAELHRAYRAEVCARQALLAELEEQREVQEQLDGILRWVGELQAAWVKEGMGSFHDSFRLVMESVQKLQDAIRQICGTGRR